MLRPPPTGLGPPLGTPANTEEGELGYAVKIYAGSDHAGVGLKERLVPQLRDLGHEVIDLGAYDETPSDYPTWAAQVAWSVRGEPGSRGLLVCGSGVGVSIAANKVQGIRAVDAFTPDVARLSRTHNDTNVLCLGARFVDEGLAQTILAAWLESGFEGGRHALRVGKLRGIETQEGAAFAVRNEVERLAARGVPARIWGRDPRVFAAEADTNEGVRASILSRLGWLDAPETMRAHLGAVKAFVRETKERGIRHVVLLGMGGSSLCPEVLAKTLGPSVPGSPTRPEGIPLLVLDSTDPAAVEAIEREIDLDHTLFLVSSKSGSTIEVAAFESHFWARVLSRRGLAEAGRQFCAVTDPNTELFHRASHRYGKVFVNPPDIGGRYSALSLFGLVPAALLGIDVDALLDNAATMATACRSDDCQRNPGVALGAFMAALAKQGRDKLTLLCSPEIRGFGAWIEQLVAESTGKLGRGVVPIDLEPLGEPSVYGDDRAFVVVRLEGGTAPASDQTLSALRLAGHPVFELALPSRLSLGAEFFRWEFATAVAGASLRINPFDEPNVTEAKEATSRAIKRYWKEGKLPQPEGVLTPAERDRWLSHLGQCTPGDYLAVCAFFAQTPKRDLLLEALRRACRDRLKVATTVGYGPRFLHSTGQLHKGGPNTGIFVQLTAAAPQDLPVPERGFSFGVLRDAQALGDLEALLAHKRRVVRVHLGGSVEDGIEQLLAAQA